MAIFRGSSIQHRYTDAVDNTAGRDRTPSGRPEPNVVIRGVRATSGISA